MSHSENIPISVEELVALASECFDKGQAVRIRAKGNSMLPFVRDGRDFLLLKRNTGAEVGDVVLAHESRGRYVVHRIIERNGDNLVLKGDGNYRGVETCRTSDVIATVYAVERPGGKTVNPSRWRNWHKLPLLIRRPVIAIVKRLSK